jgi:hypothetical protein
MPRKPKYLELDGRRYLWRDVLQLRRAQCAVLRYGSLPCSSPEMRPVRRRTAGRRAATSSRGFSMPDGSRVF